MADSRVAVGRQAEQLAEKLLKANGYRIMARNVRSRFGEIDLVAREGPTLCFVEVRARSTWQFGGPEESVTFPKQRRLIRLAQWYLKRYRCGELPMRFDVVSVWLDPDGSPARTRLIRSAFEAQ